MKQNQLILSLKRKYFGTLRASKECNYPFSFYLLPQNLMLLFFLDFIIKELLILKKTYRCPDKLINIIKECLEAQDKYFVSLMTNNGIIKLLFKDEMQSSIWISTISGVLKKQRSSWERGLIYCTKTLCHTDKTKICHKHNSNGEMSQDLNFICSKF